jgi:hypothetical protein
MSAQKIVWSEPPRAEGPPGPVVVAADLTARLDLAAYGILNGGPRELSVPLVFRILERSDEDTDADNHPNMPFELEVSGGAGTTAILRPSRESAEQTAELILHALTPAAPKA